MSATAVAHGHRRPVTHMPGLARLVFPLGIAVLAAALASAEVPSAALRLSAAEAARVGVSIALVSHRIGASNVVEIEPSQASGQTPLAVSADGGQVALADRIGEVSGSLTVAQTDGSQIRVPMRGLLGATFAPGGEWLAVVDGQGTLWRVDPLSGRSAAVAEGPFVGTPVAMQDGSLLVIAVPSVEAPYRSRLLRLDPASGETTTLSSEELVYAGFPLEGGGVAVVAHRPEGTFVTRAAGGAVGLLATLGPGAVNVSVAPDGRLAYEVAGQILMVDGPGRTPRQLGPGTRPCFAPDGSHLLLRRGSQTIVIGPDQSTAFRTDEPAALAGAVGCLP